MHDLSPVLERLNELGESLLEKTDAFDVRGQMVDKNENVQALKKLLADGQQAMDEIAKRTDDLSQKKTEVEKKLTKLQGKLQELQPINTRPAAVKRQIQEAEQISKEVDEVVEALSSVQDANDWLFDNTEVESQVCCNYYLP